MQESFTDRESLEEHASQSHQLNREGLQKLASLVEGCQWLNKSSNVKPDQQLKTPSKEFDENEHQSKDESVLDESCVVSEKHVYKYRCSQCSLAFRQSCRHDIFRSSSVIII